MADEDDENQEQAKEILEEYRNKISLDFDKEVENLLGDNISALEAISKISESVASKLRNLYKEKFPKTCKTCGVTYNSREDFLQATVDLAKHGVLFTEELNKVQEYRNCKCGSTLMVAVSDRRDTTAFGQARRELFDQCVARIVETTGKDQEEATELVRTIFRKVITAVQSGD